MSSSTLQAAELTAHQAGEKHSPTEEETVDDLSCWHFLKLHVAWNVSQKYRTALDRPNRWPRDVSLIHLQNLKQMMDFYVLLVYLV